MKKMMFLAAAAVVALSGCVKSESVDLGGKKAIAFEAFNEVSARGPIEGTAYPAGGEFKTFAVFNNGDAAYFTPTDFGDGDANGEWSGDPARYWPTTGVLDFAAYHPASLAGTANPTYTCGIESIVITGINNKDAQEDIMFSNLIDDADCTDHSSRPMVFNHALSQIEVHVVANKAGVFEVTNLTLNSTVQGGTLTINPAVSSTAAWSAPTAGVNMAIVDSAVAVPATVGKIGSSILVVPGAQTSLDLTYTIDGSAPIAHPTINLATNGNWDMGKKYIYTITFGAHEITFEPSVADSWTPAVPVDGGTI